MEIRANATKNQENSGRFIISLQSSIKIRANVQLPLFPESISPIRLYMSLATHFWVNLVIKRINGIELH
jgi:hypothetical protein